MTTLTSDFSRIFMDQHSITIPFRGTLVRSLVGCLNKQSEPVDEFRYFYCMWHTILTMYSKIININYSQEIIQIVIICDSYAVVQYQHQQFFFWPSVCDVPDGLSLTATAKRRVHYYHD